MKKTIIAAAFATVATFGFSGMASAAYDLGAECLASVEANPLPEGATMEQMQMGCQCLTDNVGGDAAIVASFEAAAGDQTKWSPEAAAAVQACFGGAE
jgi:hypothetical protein